MSEEETSPQDVSPEGFSEEEKPKKRKIDLKSRLSSVRASGSMAALPSAGGSDPLAFPPPAVQGSVPPPKMLSGAGGGFGPVSSPFAPPEPEVKKSAQQQTIKVEVGEEVLAYRKKARRKTLLYVALTTVIFLAVGFALGGARERGLAGHKAITGAAGLAKDVKAANVQMKDMAQELMKAAEKLGQDEYPDDLSAFLSKTNVAFDASRFRGRSVGGLPPEVLKSLLAFTQGVAQLNRKKDALRNLLGAAKKQTLKYFDEKKNPVVNFSILLEKQADKVSALLVMNKKPFKSKEKKWPEKYTVITPAGKKTKDVEAVRFDGKGKLFDGKKVIPVKERTVARYSSKALVGSLSKALRVTKEIIDGNNSPIPALQTDGLIKTGTRLAEALEKTAAAK